MKMIRTEISNLKPTKNDIEIILKGKTMSGKSTLMRILEKNLPNDFHNNVFVTEISTNEGL